jgi:putative phosphoesterase
VRIGIVSDTHGYYHPELDEVFAGLDAILHAGDVGAGDVLERLEALAPVIGVYGNIDGPPVRGRLKEHVRVRLGGLRVWMTHIGGHPARWAPGIGAALRADPPDLFICGHSHILRIERVRALGGMLYLNPGAAGRQGFQQVKTCVRLRVEAGVASEAEVIHLADPVRAPRRSA